MVAFGRLQLALVVVVALVAFALRAEAQTLQPPAPGAPEHAPAPVPFTVGEELVYHATFGVLPAGTARMRVEGIDTIRGTPAYHVVFVVDGGIPFFRVHDRYESWMSVATLSSLRYIQRISEGRYHRQTTYELFPERAEFQKNGEPPEPSVENPLDEGSFIYAARAARIRVGDTLKLARYFVRDRNPVTFIGDRADTVDVGAGTFAAIVVRPSIRTNGLFSENGEAQVWFSDDEARLPVQVKTRFAHFSLTLTLDSLVGVRFVERGQDSLKSRATKRERLVESDQSRATSRERPVEGDQSRATNRRRFKGDRNASFYAAVDWSPSIGRPR